MSPTCSQTPIPCSDPTIGYRLNHFMLRISDPSRTLHFYTHLMGMRLVFSRDVGPMTVYYLGYPSTAEHRADQEAYARDTSPHSVLTSTLGLLEFCHYHVDSARAGEEKDGVKITTGVDPPFLGFNHLGFTVPDVPAAVERLMRSGVVVVKGVGEGPNESVPITRWERETGVASTMELSKGFEALFKQIAFVRDPDGYLVELVPQVLQ
ncbi:Lactoylglutathione lyase [Ascochyta rabiei]|uniref:Lyase n=1 Tax=Didymella rabiei TaxID=5454 RepID=A0A162X9C2_DIDRA|nr:Lactoylglutathione lyase [Ascochyta rabiei]KZM19417.1 lyase [Ascochyta rabiei]UPX12473.1 Lactoylglutathione lyase [Ascochyta rabiei]